MDEQEKNYRQMLAQHDWFYDYSDDHSAWSAGRAQREKLRELRKQIDPDSKIWDEIAPAEFKQKTTI